MDVRSIEGVAPVVEHNGTVPVWWMVQSREMKEATEGGFLELVNEFEVAGGGAVDPHSHPTHEFYYVLNGRGIMTIEGEDREIAQGDLVHIPPNAVHTLRPVSDNAPIHCFCFAIGLKGAGPIDYTHHWVAEVLVTRHLPDGGLDPLVEACHTLIQRPDDVAYSTEELAAAAPEVDGIVCLLTDRIDRTVLAAGAQGRLKVVGNAAVGYDNVDLEAAAEYDIAVCNTPGVLDQTTADLAFLLVLSATRLASEAEADLRAGRWGGWGFMDHLARDVHGGVLGLVGYGRIARQVARRAEGFGMEVLHHARTPTGFPGYVSSLDELLATADVVSLHVPLSPVTRHLIGPTQLATMKPTGVLVNTSRGPVVDEEALVDALEAGTIFAAGLDVYDGEPAINPRLLAAPHTVLLPHIGSATTGTRTRMARLAAQGVADVLAGRVPPNLVGR